MLEPMLAVILAPVWLVVTAHVAAAVALVGLLPATAVLITSDGLPANAIWLMASTWKVTVCVAVAKVTLSSSSAVTVVYGKLRKILKTPGIWRPTWPLLRGQPAVNLRLTKSRLWGS